VICLGSRRTGNHQVEVVGRPGLEPGTLGLKVRAGAFQGSSALIKMGFELHLCSQRRSCFAYLGREL